MRKKILFFLFTLINGALSYSCETGRKGVGLSNYSTTLNPLDVKDEGSRQIIANLIAQTNHNGGPPEDYQEIFGHYFAPYNSTSLPLLRSIENQITKQLKDQSQKKKTGEILKLAVLETL